MKIKIINKSPHSLPKYETENSAGMDIKAFIDKSIILNGVTCTWLAAPATKFATFTCTKTFCFQPSPIN